METFRRMKKAPSGRGLPSLSGWECVYKSGGGSSVFLCDFLFRAEPIFQFVTVLPASFLIEFVGALADLVFEFLGVTRRARRRFLWGICVHGRLLWEENYL